MALARWQATIVDEAGNVLPGASVEVRSETAGNPLASLFSDRAGTVGIANPATADGDGHVFFHTAGGAYRILASKGGFSKEWRYVPVGLAGESDGYAAGIPLRFDDATADADPGAGEFRMNNATPGSVTSIFIDDLNLAGSSIASFLDTFDDNGGTANRGVVYLQTVDASRFMIARVTGSVVNGTGYRKLTVTPLVTSAIFIAGETVYLTFVANGLDGVNGITSGVQMTFSSTTAMNDPGAGLFRFNNPSLASVTAAAIDDLSSVTGNPDISAFVLSWDDSTQTNNRGLLIIKVASAPQNFIIFRITGATTDNAGWSQLALTYVMHAGSFTNNDVCIIEFYRSADAVAAATDTLQGIIELATLAEVVAGSDTTRAVVPSTLFGVGAAMKQGKQTIWVPAAGMYKANAAGGPASGQIGAGALTAAYLGFDPGTTEDAHAIVAMPKSWDLGAISARFYWFHGATVTNFTVAWTFYAKAYGDGESLDGASYAGGITINDTGGLTDRSYISAEGGSFTPAGTPAANDPLHFIFRRLGADGTDSLAVDANLLGVQLYFNTNAATDA